MDRWNTVEIHFLMTHGKKKKWKLKVGNWTWTKSWRELWETTREDDYEILWNSSFKSYTDAKMFKLKKTSDVFWFVRGTCYTYSYVKDYKANN